jgi:NADH dehydrogenase FAD-containing subunit
MTGASSSRPAVVVVGGGYGGVAVAKALDDHAHVILVEPKDAFHHNVAALRGLVDPAWPARTFLTYEHLLSHGTVIQDRAVAIDPDGVLLASGQRLSADYLVLATGSTYPFPAKSDWPGTADAVEHYHAMHANLARAERVMLLGAGAVGLELAGEIAAAWPNKRITLIDLADQILPGPFDPRLRDELNRQLDGLGVQRILGSPLATPPPTDPGELKPFEVVTADGRSVEADIWFRCYGVTPATGYLTGPLALARTPDGYLTVTPQLQVQGFDTIYALGDIAATDVNKAAVASRQGEVVANNIKAQITGSTERATYVVAPTSIILPLGPTGGAGQRADTDEIVPAEVVSRIKGADLMIDRYIQLLNIPTIDPDGVGVYGR